MKNAGFEIVEGDSAIVPVMLYDAKLSQTMANLLLDEGIYVIGFFYPVVPKGKARIRVQLSASHNKEHLDKFIGKTIKIKLKNKLLDRKNFKGQLLNRVKNTITINDHDNKEIEIDIKLIDICRIVPVFK